MKWLHGYSSVILSISSLIASVAANYSHNHIHEGDKIIVTFVGKIISFFSFSNNLSNTKSMMAIPWHQQEGNLILIFQTISVVIAAIGVYFVILAVMKSEKSLFYATAVVTTAFALYFINAKVALVTIFLIFIVILNLRKKVGINT